MATRKKQIAETDLPGIDFGDVDERFEKIEKHISDTKDDFLNELHEVLNYVSTSKPDWRCIMSTGLYILLTIAYVILIIKMLSNKK